MIRRAAAYILLIGVYGFTWLVAVTARAIPRRAWRPTGRIMVTGTFHNPNWYLSHITPLSRSGVKEVIVVTDEPQLPLDKIRFVCPPKWALRLLGRVSARTIWVFIASLSYRPDLYIGYYLAPGGCSALVAGKLLGRPCCYQMTGGPVGIVGGGFAAIDSIEGTLGHPSKLIESLALKVIREFDLVIVRGCKAKTFLANYGINENVRIITGSVKQNLQPNKNIRDIDLIFIGRLSPIKQLNQFIEIVSSIKKTLPNILAIIVGDGPIRANLQTYTEELELTRNIEFLGKQRDVESLLVRSKIFVLTSKSEGLSIAMAEAMCAGVVPVVSNVGDLGDLVTDGINGYLIEPDNISQYSNRIVSLLQNNEMWTRLSQKAVESAREHCHIDVVSEKWRQCLRDVISKASGFRKEDIWN